MSGERSAEPQVMLEIGEVAKKLKKSAQVLRKWEREGTLPRTPYWSERGRRQYTPAMVRAIRKALEAFGRGDQQRLTEDVQVEFATYVKTEWKKEGIEIDEREHEEPGTAG